MITALKDYLSGVITAADLAGPIYTDASESKRHKRPPWASILTPSERQGLDLNRVDKTIKQDFDDDTKIWTRIVKVFEAVIHLDVVICAADEAAADALNTAFLAGLDKHIHLDPEHPDGWFVDPAEVVSNLNQSVTIQATGAVTSDTVAAIRDEYQISTRLVITGGVLKEQTTPALPGVSIDHNYQVEGGN